MIKHLSTEAMFKLDLTAKMREWGRCAFVARYANAEDRFALGIAVANAPGIIPVPSFWAHADTFDEAMSEADRLNRDVLKLNADDAWDIIGSSMRGRTLDAKPSSDGGR